MRRWIALSILLLCVPLPGQEEEDQGPYFSLTSQRTWMPGEKASIQLAATQVESLDFRLYRVKDPLRFFDQLEDVEHFGGKAPAPPRKLTPLERFHAFKRDRHTALHELLRAQFTTEARTRMRAWFSGGQPRKIERVTGYAQTPLLNPQQVVAVWRQPVTPGNRWQTKAVPIDLPGKGVYVVEAVHQNLRAYTFMVVSNLAFVTANSPGRMTAYVGDRSTGAPVPRCPVTMREGKTPAVRFDTGADGLVDLPIKDPRPENILLVAHRGDDFAVHAPATYYLGTDPRNFTTGYIYTDRPVYRPGHTVRFRAIVRTQVGNEYQIPSVRDVSARVTDNSEGRPVFQKTLRLSAHGTVNGEFTLPAATGLGYYGIELKLGEAEVNGGFEVEEYRKPEYEVRVTAEKKRVLQGEALPMLVDARYYFGEPVANAKVAWGLYRARYWSGFEDDDDDMADSGWMGDQVEEGSGRLDAEGKLRIPAPTKLWAYDAVYRLQARVTDEAGREVSGMGYAIATRGSFGVHVAPARYVYKPGDRAELRITARDYDGQGVRTAVRLQMRRAPRRKGEQPPVLFTAEAQTGADGTASVEVPVPGAGSFEVTATARTPEQRDVSGRAYLWVSGSFESRVDRRIEIVPDKKSYRPGDVARVLVVTGVPQAHVLFSVEGRKLESTRLIHATEPSFTVEVPVRLDHEPNFYVSACFLRENRFYEGTKALKVPPIEKKLSVAVQPSKPQFKPGEPAEFAIEARDSEGRPVAAEFSLGIVDEAVYGVRPEMTPDILNYFYGRAYNRVGHQSSLQFHFTGEAGKRRMMLTSIRPHSALAQLKPERLVEARVRKAFPDTVYWAADLMTDANGRARARLEFPDSLTTWRATARGVTRDTRVGSAIAKAVVRKNLVLRLTAPRFFTEGDEMTVSALVHNYLADTKTARVSLEAKGLEMIEGGTRDVTVASRADARVEFRVRATAPGQAVLLGKALTNEESDALEIAIPINSYGVKLSQARSGTGAASFEMALPVPGKIRISLAASPAGSIFGALEFLTTFPYGCTEQTMSSFLPNLVVARALEQLKVPSSVDRSVLQRQIRTGLARLIDYQHEDGGWGWWQTDDSQTFMTAYVLSGLAQARAAGYHVRPSIVKNAAAWLRANPGRGDLGAFSAYALALAGDKQLEAAWNERRALSAYGLALMGLALDAAADARAQDIAAQLESKAKVTAAEAWWPVERDVLMDLWSDATPEATAYALKLLVKLRPQSPLLDKAAVWLVAHRREGAWWDSTKQTATVIYGLTDYLQRTGELKPNFSATVLVNGREVLARKFTAADALSVQPPSVELAAGAANRIEIRAAGEGRLYWSARAEYYSPDPKLAQQGKVALNILREYFRLAPVRRGERIVYRIEPLAGAVQSGDLLAARLTVSGGDWRYLMVEDPLPAGVEAVTREAAYELESRPPWWDFWFTRREYRDDRVALFQTWFRAGQRQFFYLMKVVNAGRFRISPARVEPMYQPQFRATTEAATLEVKP